ncbi:MAG: HAMP domain-containing histidine kinase, partial [Deltaproteobacteria bacterium]|nr:HAMP domain-containing histidine kinase [Nannocystaceae bacterium]
LPAGVPARFVIEPGGVAAALGDVPGDVRSELLALVALQSTTATIDAVDDVTEQVQAYQANSKTKGVGKVSSIGWSQQDRNELEYGKRVATVQENLLNSSLSNPTNVEEGLVRPGVDGVAAELQLAVEPATAGLMRPLWWGDELVLVRRLPSGSGARVEGSWLDWPTLRTQLAGEIEDLLPEAQLVPAAVASSDGAERLLATLPLRLEPGALELPATTGARPLQVALAVGWVFVVLAISAFAVLLRASMQLSERRALFVSAVTHELRTPLTTFRMYTEMLESGMVEAKRARYISTLRREAERLGHLVENVLSYARIEADREARALEPRGLAELLDGVIERLAERCRAAEVTLALEVDADARADRVLCDASAVEQILFNLVDNAAKYGASADDPRIVVRATREGRMLALHVRDFGAGVPAAERGRVFAPFAKGSAHIAGTKPGVGLGLALSRRMAEQMHGKLELRSCEGGERGADFVLSLPRA